MPLYEYECPECGERDDVVAKVSELETLKVHCTICAAEMNRLIGNNGGFRLNGDCWARDGYARYFGDIKT